jgi:hypothetical protein
MESAKVKRDLHNFESCMNKVSEKTGSKIQASFVYIRVEWLAFEKWCILKSKPFHGIKKLLGGSIAKKTDFELSDHDFRGLKLLLLIVIHC